MTPDAPSPVAGSAGSRIVVLRTAQWLPPDVLTAAGWDALRGPRVYAAGEHPLGVVLAAAGIDVTVLDGGPSEVAAAIAGTGAAATWLELPERSGADASPSADAAIVAALLGAGAELVVGSVDPPGARLLDAVRVMDRLRSPGGCPWDAEQTHGSLAKYLLEEAYETIELIEGGQLAELAEEIGDVLLQVLFHARVSSERTDGTGWTVDDVAGGLVDKLVRRHPHVFAGLSVDGTAEVVANWDTQKAREKGRTSVTEGVPLAQPALALVEKLLARSGRAGLPDSVADADLAAADPATVLRDLLAEAPSAVHRDADDAA
ncbi:MAG: hypothetical protein QOF57_56, partial [Frankiaceae bacterium]|nr:hypothetical protein [Frankiaceae bacterium]